MDKSNSIINMNNKLLPLCLLVVALGHASFSQDNAAKDKERKNREEREAARKRSIEAALPIVEDANFSIDITSKKNTFYGGEFIGADITLKNNGANEMRASPDEVETFFDIEMTGGLYGGQVERLPGSFRRYAGSMNIYHLLPGRKMSGSVSLSSLFDMSLAGTYNIKVSKRFRLKDAKGQAVTITSNTLTVKVTSDAPLSQWDAGVGP
jgi:hypothetical protein